ncbi:restriction endonuclease subunit S [Vibrio sp. 10N.286.49.E11]|uniref:restriction endonuclease subunit S n=1 Tax=Vibrio sp. 10N.286.49.E11 TaxID=3229703 RepID=UPI00354E1415
MSQNFVSLGEITQFINGDRGKNYPAKGSFVDEGVAFINAGSLSQEHSIDSCSLNYITEAKYDSLSSGKVAQGDILFCLRGSIGKFALITEQMTGAIASSLVIVRPSEKVFTGYLKHYFASNLCRREIDNFENGAAQPNLSATDLKEFRIPLPPLVEQKRIAAILDKADAIRQKRKQAIDLADEFLRSVFLDMFGDPVTNPKGWEKSSLTKFGDFKNGMNYGKGEAGQSLYSIGVGDFKSFDRILGTATLSTIELNEMPDKSYLLEDGDLLFVRSNGNKALVGRCLTVHPENEDVTYSGFCIRYRIDSKEQLDSDFVNYCMRIPSMKHAMLKGGQGANIQNINQKILSELMLPIPPIELQRQFSSTVRAFRLAQGRVIESSQSSTSLFDSLSQKAFSGEL